MPRWHCAALLFILLSYFVVNVKHLQSKYFCEKTLFLIFCHLSFFSMCYYRWSANLSLERNQCIKVFFFLIYLLPKKKARVEIHMIMLPYLLCNIKLSPSLLFHHLVYSSQIHHCLHSGQANSF